MVPLNCAFSSAVEQCIIRITISDPENIVETVDGTPIEYVEASSAFGLTFNKTNNSSNLNASPTNYDLATAKGMLEWKNRLVLWGVQNAETVLFTSDVNNPAYFPYPNNIDILDEPILHCMLYGDDLIVFTNTKLYRLTIGETGGVGTHTLVQKNLNITEKDLPMFCVVKNMLFFKSGNYYYMLVPKSGSVSGETTIAPVSNTINNLLDNFTLETQRLFKIYTQGKVKATPGMSWELPITDFLEAYYAYVDNASVVLNFVYDYSAFIDGHPVSAEEYTPLLNKRCFVVSLVYDTEAYAWSIKIYETPRIPTPVSYNALGQQQYMYVVPQPAEEGDPGVVFVQNTLQNTADMLVLYRTDTGIIYDYDSIKELNSITYSVFPLQQNYQYLDTGYRVLTSSVDIKKRFREVQFSINNTSQKALTFYTAFIVDGNLRKDMQGYTTKMLVDPDDPRTGVLLVERPYIDEKYLPSVPDYVIQVADYVQPDITPGDTTLDDTFVLDNTQLPDLAYWKVRIDVSGKGFTPRLQILSVNDKEYSILSTNWVYRTMNSR